MWSLPQTFAPCSPPAFSPQSQPLESSFPPGGDPCIVLVSPSPWPQQSVGRGQTPCSLRSGRVWRGTAAGCREWQRLTPASPIQWPPPPYRAPGGVTPEETRDEGVGPTGAPVPCPGPRAMGRPVSGRACGTCDRVHGLCGSVRRVLMSGLCGPHPASQGPLWPSDASPGTGGAGAAAPTPSSRTLC